MELGGGEKDGSWSQVGLQRKYAKLKWRIQQNISTQSEYTESERDVVNRWDQYIFCLKLVQEGASFGEWNPIKLTKAVNKLVGEMESSRVLRNGSANYLLSG